MPSSPEDVNDLTTLERVKELAQLMELHGLSEVELREENRRIRLRRGNSSVESPVPLAPPVAAAPSPPPSSDVADEANVATIRSPMVGTFYAKPNPNAPPFVTIGDHVGHDTTVCVIEAMKVFNEIAAEVSGKIIAVLVENEEPVEFGKPLFKVQTSD